MANHARPYSVTSLEDVQARFAAWRSRPLRARRIPDGLWDAAVSLCAEHSVCKVSRALRLDCNTLRQRSLKSEKMRHPRAFVELGLLRVNETEDLDMILAMGTWTRQDLANSEHNTPIMSMPAWPPEA